MKLLVFRRDNIGDLVLTMPVFAALRARFPSARIDALVNSYNAAVLDRDRDVDTVHAYTKTKHSASRWDSFTDWAGRLSQFAALRRERYDHVVLASPGYHPRQIRQARLLRPGDLVAFVPPGMRPAGVTTPVEYAGPYGHHADDTFRILAPFGITGPAPCRRLDAPDRGPRPAGAPLTIAVHVSARRPSSRWPEQNYARLMAALHRELGAAFVLFWAPGDENDPRHPGDDAKARRILEAASALPVKPLATRTLKGLIDGLADCDAVVCSDGGAMHLAAALGKPIACFFGDSPAAEWHPRGVPYRLLQPASRDVSDVNVEEALAAVRDVLAEAKLA